MASKLTAATVTQAKAGKARREIPDGGCAGLYLVIQPGGAKSWALRYRSPVDLDRQGRRKAKKLTLGSVAVAGDAPEGEPRIGASLSLADARAVAIAALRKVGKCVDPAHDYRVKKQSARLAVSKKAEVVFAEFMAKHVRKRNGKPVRESTRRETGRLLGLLPGGTDGKDLTSWILREPKSGVLAQWAGRDVASISKRDVLDLLDSIVEDGATIVANRTLAALKTAFTWSVKRDIISVSPCDHVDNPSPESSIERNLSNNEIVALWRAAERTGYPYGRMVQLLLLTGQRRDEVRELPRSEMDLPGRVWKLPGARTKNGRDHLVPLSDAVVMIIAELPRIKSKAGWLFTTDGEVPMANLSKRKRRLGALMLEELQRLDPEITEVTPWRLHDLRHTLKTWMQGERIPKDVRNAVQNHYDGDMDELYGHHTFEKEKRDALERWAQCIRGLTSVEPSDLAAPIGGSVAGAHGGDATFVTTEPGV
jgi:integrase